MAILCAPFLSACPGKQLPPPRAELILPDQAALAPCLALIDVPPAIEALDVLTLPDGRKVYLLDQVRENNAVTSRYIVELRGQRAECRSAAVSIASWIREAQAKTAVRQNAK